MMNSTTSLTNNLRAIPNVITSQRKLRKSSWFELKNITNHTDFSKQYARVCEQHNNTNKWILLINPDESSLGQLSHMYNIDTTKILCVNIKTTNINLEQIKSTLNKGNCSAVILSNASFTSDEINQLGTCAQQGSTQCIVLQRECAIQKIIH